VHEDVVTALTFNESVPFCVVEPLDLAGDAHTNCLPYENRDVPRRLFPCRDSTGATRYKSKDRCVRSQSRHWPVQRQRGTLAGGLGEVNLTESLGGIADDTPGRRNA
jgi:hypothetical protein